MTRSLSFGFEGNSVRVMMDEKGEPWWVARDVCNALGIEKPQNAYARLDDDEKGACSTGTLSNTSVETSGGPQDVMMINESGLYSLILGSRKPAAKRFKKWVTSEVLPSIRKTGSYYATTPIQPNVSAELADKIRGLSIVRDALRTSPGVRSGILDACFLEAVRQNTGMSVEGFRLSLPPAEDVPGKLNATALGQKLALSAVTTNKRLCEKGLQIKNERGDWELTENGRKFAEALPFNRNGHSGYQILWREDVLETLQ